MSIIKSSVSSIPSLFKLISPPPTQNYASPPVPSLMIDSFNKKNNNRRAAVLTSVSVVGKRYKGTAMREEKLSEMIEKKVAEAMEACEGEGAKGSDGCKVAWDEVEEVSQAKAHLKRRLAESDVDPLESFCQGNPETDECTVYDDSSL